MAGNTKLSILRWGEKGHTVSKKTKRTCSQGHVEEITLIDGATQLMSNGGLLVWVGL